MSPDLYTDSEDGIIKLNLGLGRSSPVPLKPSCTECFRTTQRTVTRGVLETQGINLICSVVQSDTDKDLIIRGRDGVLSDLRLD